MRSPFFARRSKKLLDPRSRIAIHSEGTLDHGGQVAVNSQVYKWFIHGVYTVYIYICLIYGLYMVDIWFLYGSYMVYVWCMYGLYMVYRWV